MKGCSSTLWYGVEFEKFTTAPHGCEPEEGLACYCQTVFEDRLEIFTRILGKSVGKGCAPGGGNLTCLWYGVVPFFRVPFS